MCRRYMDWPDFVQIISHFPRNLIVTPINNIHHAHAIYLNEQMNKKIF